MLWVAALKGFVLMASVIVAIGPQNAFMLRQAARKDHAWLVASIMLSGDIIMVSLGGFGIGQFLGGLPWFKLALTLLGAAYIFRFALSVLRQMPQAKSLTTAAAGRMDIVTGALAVTFLNPHAIFDTVVLVGTVALQFKDMDKIAFMLGAMTGSTLWFYGLAWAGQKAAPFLSRPEVWRVIDGFIVMVMLCLFCMLAFDAWGQAKTLFAASY